MDASQDINMRTIKNEPSDVNVKQNINYGSPSIQQFRSIDIENKDCIMSGGATID